MHRIHLSCMGRGQKRAGKKNKLLLAEDNKVKDDDTKNTKNKTIRKREETKDYN